MKCWTWYAKIVNSLSFTKEVSFEFHVRANSLYRITKPKTNYTHDCKNPLSHKKETEKTNKNKKINQRL